MMETLTLQQVDKGSSVLHQFNNCSFKTIRKVLFCYALVKTNLPTKQPNVWHLVKQFRSSRAASADTTPLLVMTVGAAVDVFHELLVHLLRLTGQHARSFVMNSKGTSILQQPSHYTTLLFLVLIEPPQQEMGIIVIAFLEV
jgi:hypothetical protein